MITVPISTAKVHITFLPGYGTSGDVNVSALSGLGTILNTTITPQLDKQLGVKVGGADGFAVPRPSCSDPQLAC
jgi:hypothetical protein